MSAGPAGISLSSALDRGAIGHEPSRGRLADVQCCACSAMCVVPDDCESMKQLINLWSYYYEIII